MKILQNSKKMEAKLDFFNRQPPDIQEKLLETGYFSSNASSDRSARPALTQLKITIPVSSPT